MNQLMRANKLERIIISSVLADQALKVAKSEVNYDAVVVENRELTGVGFLTEFERSEELKLFDDDVSFRWGKVGARLNTSKVETGYLVYVDDGYLTTIEGYTYGDEWPERIEQIEVYELKSDTELMTPPT